MSLPVTPPPTLRDALDGTRMLFLLHHAGEPVRVRGGLDLLTGERIDPGLPFGLDAYGVRVLREYD